MEENVFFECLFENAFELFIEHPFIFATAIMALYIFYKITTFSNIVIDYSQKRQIEMCESKNADSLPSFPNGWIPILESREIGVNEVKSVVCLGVEMAVVRGATGQVSVLDAFCPHLGANLAVGGTVHQQKDNGCQQDCIRCPFHGWSFRLTDGKCTNIPYEKEPVNAKVKLWPSIETIGYIFVWHHVDGEKPTWMLEPMPEIASKKLAYVGSTKFFVSAPLQDIFENVADGAHLSVLHSSLFYCSSLLLFSRSKKWPLIVIKYKLKWGKSEGNVATAHLETDTTLFGWLTLFTIKVEAKLIGPAYNEMRFRIDRFNYEGFFIQFFTPLGQKQTKLVFHVYGSKGPINYLIGKLILFGETLLIQQDMAIWNNKVYVPKPPLTKSEKSIALFRRWYKQFYTTTSSINW